MGDLKKIDKEKLKEYSALLKSKKEKSQEFEKNEKLKYEQSHKNVLWVDDRNDSLEWMKRYLENESDIYSIKQVSTFFETVKELKNAYKYDLVIFDLDLEHGFPEFPTKDRANEEEYLENEFKKYHIDFNYDEVSGSGKKTAGVYLYLLLISQGYPINRMLIYTGNSTNFMEDKLAYFNFKEISKQKKQVKLSIEDYFPENGYYRVRRLIFEACEYWRKNCPDTKKIPFNTRYYSDNKIKMINKSAFVDMLDRIEMLFPVVEPSDPEKVYYQVMQAASIYHEESAIIDNASGNVRKYHCLVRNFRNWIAHNKFRDKKLKPDEFALLFCIALRTYFDKQLEDDFDANQLDYEQRYFDDKNSNFEYDERKEDIIVKKWRDLISEINDKGRYDIPKSMTIEDVILHIGFQSDKIRVASELFLGLFNIIECVNKDKEKVHKEIQLPKKEGDFVYSITCVYTYESKVSAVKNLSQADKLFLGYAYKIINP